MNKRTIALTPEQYKEIIEEMQTEQRGRGFRANKTIATALIIEANLGLRISDIVPYKNPKTGKESKGLRLKDIKKSADGYHLDITEQKTGKKRTFTVLPQMYAFLADYCLENDIARDQPLCDVSERRIQKYLEAVCNYLDIENISTHSFRKFFATQIYINNDYDIALVQKLLQHSSPATTQKYIGIESQRIENALKNHLCI